MASLMTKVTLFFEQSTTTNDQTPGVTRRLAGWTESFYLAGDQFNATGLDAIIDTLMTYRARLLSTEAYIKGYRISLIDPTGKSRTFKITRKGSTRLRCDDPEQALTINLRGAGKPNRRILTIRGVPDARVEGGTYNPETGYDQALIGLVNVLKQNSFGFRGRDLEATKAQIDTIDAAGVVVLKQNFANPGQQEVQVLRTIAAGHRAKGFQAQLSAYVDATHMTIRGWPASIGATKGGVLRLVNAPVFVPIEVTDAEVRQPEVRTRQTGRPFNQSRGRRSAQYK